ncbi:MULTISPECIES: fumarylacetoacetate hydrolase family protein [unclassified Mesorhizobium]|uniref:fumarylacetoacetate hydrolase family protein n=1 Tax=unclassified Mesorhizobium TaxID=325217 RepID=UPI000FD745E0|nr:MULTISPECIES: fumarylacetoacetate hydrolase family protein [unclassified Mesorhizobium]TGR37919.1 fumarylacetoacetate hydrolase [bacterium M00.F.Ca.ET.199.01.1.1]TGU23558.1 fumarylacetoacetate hydrolase [bacterium M00.F.Ca.ET.156.01.1.1]TGV90910.1 fumarylacetoacetate hydrolase [Mesorhizobium sp. M00.F.Ca.ET.149.01.1.1]TGR18231.1 fumarylacetoacetate hydrolase [Mesorhizobium sp. M8A.F.Ca.ET.202.01.1.1]TGR20332.1 fumarylacetoacetate hydrolase [Mesorhizobium sp. M8A.F.Ca.ET.197.01.1.1]
MTNPTHLPSEGLFVGRARSGDVSHPMVVTVRDGTVFDITSSAAPTVRDVCELADPAGHVGSAKGTPIGSVSDIAANSFEATRDPAKPFLLSPVDLQAIKASGVTFVVSLLERVIEEQARGSAEKADAIRADIAGLIGHDLSKLKPGSPEAMEIKAKLISRGAWSQYLEVGIGPDAEIFTKCQPMASVGFGADVGLHPVSTWNNPEPEIAMIAASSGRIVGATIGNDVNLRDVEGRSALLLGKAKDNNASASLGPFIRLFDETFSIADVKQAVVRLKVEGEDGFSLEGASSMAEISRSPEELVAAAMGPHHQYPDGLALYLGTMFVPSKDRGEKGKGFTHKVGDIVTISSEKFGALVNRVRLSPDCPHWTYGASHLMRDLSKAGLL